MNLIAETIKLMTILKVMNPMTTQPIKLENLGSFGYQNMRNIPAQITRTASLNIVKRFVPKFQNGRCIKV